MNANRVEDNQDQISQLKRRQLTHMSFELERCQLARSLMFFREQSSSAKLLLFHQFHQMLEDGVKNVYRCCVQPHLINEHRENEYLGYRMDLRLVSLNLSHFDYKLVCEMERLIDINFKEYLIMDDGDYLTVTYHCHFIILFCLG